MNAMKIKTITDSVLAAIVFVVVSCATSPKQVESPPGRYEIHQKDDRGVTVSIHQTTRFTETLSTTPTGKSMILNFVDNTGKPRSFKSYDIFKL